MNNKIDCKKLYLPFRADLVLQLVFMFTNTFKMRRKLQTQTDILRRM